MSVCFRHLGSQKQDPDALGVEGLNSFPESPIPVDPLELLPVLPVSKLLMHLPPPRAWPGLTPGTSLSQSSASPLRPRGLCSWVPCIPAPISSAVSSQKYRCPSPKLGVRFQCAHKCDVLKNAAHRLSYTGA